ncbi:hypothetical protein [Paratractidigestivibacter faecalis]|uniref:hypothetical protein n=1 Tax=Paratractidigestivibacter faecalis TaxID=2292441 RepID=UPI003890370C
MGDASRCTPIPTCCLSARFAKRSSALAPPGPSIDFPVLARFGERQRPAQADDLAKETWAGDYGNGSRRKAVLGPRYDEVMAVINGQTKTEQVYVGSERRHPQRHRVQVRHHVSGSRREERHR